MTSPLISVVCAVYNGERYLRGSVESILSQEGADFEIVVMDDGSTDGSGEILDELAGADKRLRVVHQENSGLTRALVRGCELARGRYIARHDGDDLSLPGRLAAQARVLDDDTSIAFVSSWARVIGPNDEFLYEVTREQSRPARLAEDEGPCGHGTVMMRRDAYVRTGGYRPQFRYAQDWDLWWRMGEQGSLAVIPEFLYAYRVHLAGASAGHRGVQRRYGALAVRCARARAGGQPEDDLLAEAAGLSVAAESPRSTGAASDYFIGRALVRRRDPAAREYLWSALRQQPWRLRAWFSLLQLELQRGDRR